MSEFVKEVKMLIVDMKCDKCNEGVMRPIGTYISSCPPQYPHVCNKCGYQENYESVYPDDRVILQDTKDEK